MKFEPHKWPLVRYFRRPATSVPPKIEPEGPSAAMLAAIESDRISELILKQLVNSGSVLVRHVDPREMLGFDDMRAAAPPRPGIKPPPDAGTNGWTWSQWSKEVAGGGVIPGWAFCRFANRLGPESVGFVFGHVRGGFGVWRQPFDVCTSDYEGVQQRSEILTCVTHLRTGVGVGIFIDRDTAILAAELAERVCPAWQYEEEVLGDWRGHRDRAFTAWHGIGIRSSVNAHAHDQHGTRFTIYGQDTESVMAGKPERLS
jgi:hypothetical protein